MDMSLIYGPKLPSYTTFFPKKGNCGVCRYSLKYKISMHRLRIICGSDTVAHEGDGKKHPLHRRCAQIASEHSSLCPSCRIATDTSSLFTWKDRCITELTNIGKDVFTGLIYGWEMPLIGGNVFDGRYEFTNSPTNVTRKLFQIATIVIVSMSGGFKDTTNLEQNRVLIRKMTIVELAMIASAEITGNSQVAFLALSVMAVSYLIKTHIVPSRDEITKQSVVGAIIAGVASTTLLGSGIKGMFCAFTAGSIVERALHWRFKSAS